MSECNILWCGKYHQNWENELHCHNFFQMIAITSGEGSVYIDEEKYDIEKEQIYLLCPQQLHSIKLKNKSCQPLRLLDAKFTVGDPALFEDLSGVGSLIKVADFGRFSRVFDKIIAESAQQKPYYYSIVSNSLYELLVNIIRESKGEAPLDSDEFPSKIDTYKGIDVGSLIQYIEFNYANIISLEDLSTLAGMNKTSLIAIFKDLYGTTPIRYINRIRLRKAKELLVNTDTSVSEIAELVGFQSIHYFSRYFKAKEQCTPMEFRMRNSQSRYYDFRAARGTNIK